MTNDQPFSGEQQEYLKGFMAGVEARRTALGLPAGPGTTGGDAPADPNDLQRAAQDRVLAEGGKLTAEEEAKRKTPPFDRDDVLRGQAQKGEYPKGTDIFLTKFHGLFYVAPAQNAYMCRLRIPGGIVDSHKLRGIAAIAADLGGGYADITTRANFQIREIEARDAPEVLRRLMEIGLTARGSGADNIRNITGSPTAGIDPQELIDTRPHVRDLHHFILQHRALYGLPRKFNIAFNGGGRVPVLEDTNDIAFTAVTVLDGFGIVPGVYYRLGLGGITGHKDFARETGIIVPPDEATAVANAIIRVFILNGNRTDRTKARLKYLLDSWGMERFLAETERELGRALLRVDSEAIERAPVQDRQAHIGAHRQKQPGLSYLGVLTPIGRLTSQQLHGLAAVADNFGSSTLRLTVWQNLLISDIADTDIAAARAAVRALGLSCEASSLRSGLVACTGNAGCKFSASNTKLHAAALVEWLEQRITVDQPINVHLTGCHHSCAQHYIADIGLLGAKVEQGEDLVEGYDLHVGGGAGPHARIGRLVRPKVAFDDLPPMVLSLLTAWMEQRESPEESFQSFTERLPDEALAVMLDRVPVEA